MDTANNYADVYQRLIDEDDPDILRLAGEFQLVIPVGEIVSANLFDPEVYQLFRGAEVEPVPESEDRGE